MLLMPSPETVAGEFGRHSWTGHCAILSAIGSHVPCKQGRGQSHHWICFVLSMLSQHPLVRGPNVNMLCWRISDCQQAKRAAQHCCACCRR